MPAPNAPAASLKNLLASLDASLATWHQPKDSILVSIQHTREHTPLLSVMRILPQHPQYPPTTTTPFFCTHTHTPLPPLPHQHTSASSAAVASTTRVVLCASCSSALRIISARRAAFSSAVRRPVVCWCLWERASAASRSSLAFRLAASSRRWRVAAARALLLWGRFRGGMFKVAKGEGGWIQS